MSDPSVGPDESKASALADDIRMMISGLRRRLREQNQSTDLTDSQKSVIVRLERDGPTTVTGLAQAEGIRSQSMGATVASLDAMGLVSGAPDPTDGRRTILSLTGHCREILSEGRAARRDWLVRSLQTNLTAAEQDRLAGLIPLLTRLIES
jgi:DNA-binding MarR family transcriptional regulator